MTSLEIQRSMTGLSMAHPVFASEEEFRYHLGREIHKTRPGSYTAMAVPFPEISKGQLVDIVIEDNYDLTAIVDVIYALGQSPIVVNGVQYKDRTHNIAMRRYAFFNALSQIEALVYTRERVEGHVVLLTNVPDYWKQSDSTSTTRDDDFRVHQGIVTKEKHSWAKGVETRRKDAVIELKGEYHFEWADYSQPCETKGCQFRYLTVKVSR